MTREDRAREALAVQYEAHGYKHVARAVRRNTHALASPIIAAAMVQFADAEAAAMRERAADYLEEYAGGHHMAKACASVIRSFPIRDE